MIQVTEWLYRRNATATPANDEQLEKLSEEHRALVAAEVYNAFDGQDYPVLRWAHGKDRGRLAPGTGITPGHNDIARIGADTSIRRTTEYRALLERKITPDVTSGERGSLGWLLDQGFNAAEGGDVRREMTCPECGHDWTETIWKRPDANAIIKMLEMVVGRAPEQKDINIRAESIYKLIDGRENVKEITVHAVDPHEREERLSDEPEEGEWREVPD